MEITFDQPKSERIFSELSILKEKCNNLLKRIVEKRLLKYDASTNRKTLSEKSENVNQPVTVDDQSLENKNERVKAYFQNETMKLLQKAKDVYTAIDKKYKDYPFGDDNEQYEHSQKFSRTMSKFIDDGIEEIFNKMHIVSDETKLYFLENTKFSLFMVENSEFSGDNFMYAPLNWFNDSCYCSAKTWLTASLFPEEKGVNSLHLFKNCVLDYLKKNLGIKTYDNAKSMLNKFSHIYLDENNNEVVVDESFKYSFNGIEHNYVQGKNDYNYTKSEPVRKYETQGHLCKLYNPSVKDYLNILENSWLRLKIFENLKGIDNFGLTRSYKASHEDTYNYQEIMQEMKGKGVNVKESSQVQPYDKYPDGFEKDKNIPLGNSETVEKKEGKTVKKYAPYRFRFS